MRTAVKQRILTEIREGAQKEYHKNGLKLIGGPKLIAFGPRVTEEVFSQMSDEALWAALPKQMTAEIDNMTDEQLIGLDWDKIRERLKTFWAKYGDLIIAGIKILLALLMFVKTKAPKK